MLNGYWSGFHFPSSRTMVSADLNQDGYGDLIVGAPGYSRTGHIQVGRVYVLHGNDLGLPPIDLDLDKEAHVTLEGFQVRASHPCLARGSESPCLLLLVDCPG